MQRFNWLGTRTGLTVADTGTKSMSVDKLRFGWLKVQLSPVSLAVLLCLTGGWVVNQTIAPPVAQAYIGQVNVAIDVLPGESYESLVRRAEAIARAATQRSFDRDILVTDVSVVVVAQYQTSTVPILSIEASRIQWRGRPDPRLWATYYGSSRGLLGLDGVSSNTATPLPIFTTPTGATPNNPSTSPRPASTTRRSAPTTRRPASTTRRPAVTNSRPAPATPTPTGATESQQPAPVTSP